MHTTIDYSQSQAPRFDAVQDIKDYLGMENWNMAQQAFRMVRHASRFKAYCHLIGVQGFPVKAWYDLNWGQGAWDRALVRKDIADGLRVIRKACPKITAWDAHIVVAHDADEAKHNIIRECCIHFRPTANVVIDNPYRHLRGN